MATMTKAFEKLVQEVRDECPNLVARMPDGKDYKATVGGRKNDYATITVHDYHGVYVSAEYAWSTVAGIVHRQGKKLVW